MYRLGSWLPLLVSLFVLAPALPAGGAGPEGKARGSGPPDLSTPRRTLQHFVDAVRDGDFEAAAGALDLSGLPAKEREEAGPRLARQLELVLDRTLWIDPEQLSELPEGTTEDGTDVEILGTIAMGPEQVPVRLLRRAGEWRFGPGIVSRIPALFELHGPGPIGERMPELLIEIRVLKVAAWQWIGLAGALLAAWLLGLAVAWLSIAIFGRLARRTAVRWDEELLVALKGPARLIFTLAFVGPLIALLRLSLPAQVVVDQLQQTLLVVAATWLAIRLVAFFADLAETVLMADSTDESRRRGIQTQMLFLRRAGVALFATLGAALVLTQFEVVRKVGMSLLASAGIAGIVVGLAAQKTISSLLAGLQLSITQPVRIGDTVIVEGEWGTIEEIHLTYVVVKVWDLRRLIVPIGHFLDKPFQNWTKQSPEILGTVEIPADFAVPVELLREELTRICKASEFWDGNAARIQVTVATERTITARATVSSADAGKNWNLRCEVREGLIRYLRELEGGRYLPRTRIEAPGIEAQLGEASGLPENVAVAFRPRNEPPAGA